MPSSLYKNIHKKLLDWYTENSRELQWRDVNDPYITWISEVMLQQTRVQTMIPYFEKWMRTFPDLESLGDASEEDVLRLWEGLGYYSRARNIKKATDIIANSFNGTIPKDVQSLKSLPGIGDYIAAAIASIAFGEEIPALEANGKRVMARMFNYSGNIGQTASKRVLEGYLRGIVENGKAGDVNQAVMDLGSLICLPKLPLCSTCPLSSECRGLIDGKQNELPIRNPKKPIPHKEVVAAVIIIDGKVLITKRPANKMLGGLWEFPGGKVEKDESHEEALMRELCEELGIESEVTIPLARYEHAYTHFSVSVFTYQTTWTSGEMQAIEADDFLWVDIPDLSNYPMGNVDRRISRDLQTIDI